MKVTLKALICLTCGIFLLGCSQNRFDVDISNSTVEVKIKRLDKDLFEANDSNLVNLNQDLNEKYGAFYRHYLNDILLIGLPDDPMIDVSLGFFLEDPAGMESYKEIRNEYQSVEQEEEEFGQAFSYFKYYFPSEEIPEIITYNSGFNVGVYPTEKYLGVGLEWYLGPENRVVQHLPVESFPQYMREKMRREYLVPNALRGWLQVNNQDLLDKEDVASYMIFYGKMYYLLNAITPWMSDERRLNFTSRQLEWCENNAFRIWTYIIDNDLLYSTDPKEIAKLFNDGPFTPGMPQESPGRAGVWLGLQMVKAHAEKNTHLTIPELLQVQDPKQFLRSYKPKK